MTRKLGSLPLLHDEGTARKFLTAKAALDNLGPAPGTGTPWGELYEKQTGDISWLGMLGNGDGDPANLPAYPDGIGDCVICDDLRGIALWTALGTGPVVAPTTADAYALYSAITGFNPTDPNTDQGTEPATNCRYLTATGWTDATGKIHRLANWAPLDVENDNHIKWTLQCFGCVKLTIMFPNFADKQFDANQPWSYSGQTYKIEGGHDIIGVGYDADGIDVVSWGRRFKMLWNFTDQFLTGAIAPLSLEFVRQTGSAPNALNAAQLATDLGAVA